MATNQQIIQAVKKVIGKQVVEGECVCPKCETKTIFKITVSEDVMTCSVCGEQLEIQEDTYLNIYKQLKELFGDALVIE
ncbi:hypothetical protein [Paenibacillus anseongense]|uniref:hypothetical protein n=1 Tax=Paenibacillus anseongense TaxID=2682845 RepID=UPI002DBCAD93|nr:hypothetical protein [Paenibacillus anseongense]MEC0265159.1 hypothetical protein [Paenibacillus anseongense]